LGLWVDLVMNLLIISTSLNPASRSRALARIAHDRLGAMSVTPPPLRPRATSPAREGVGQGHTGAPELAHLPVPKGLVVRSLDLRELSLPTCDGNPTTVPDGARRLHEEVARADGILLALGIYNYLPSASAKGAIEHAGKAWVGKVAGFLVAAGGRSSHMAVLPLANGLMLDFRTHLLPRYVYATPEDFTDGQPSPEIARRIDDLVTDFARVTAALRG
jgi:FMN reductase